MAVSSCRSARRSAFCLVCRAWVGCWSVETSNARTCPPVTRRARPGSAAASRLRVCERSFRRDDLRGNCPDAGERAVLFANHDRGSGVELSRDPADDDGAGRGDGHPGRELAAPQSADVSGYVTHLATLRPRPLRGARRSGSLDVPTCRLSPAWWVIAAYYGFCCLLFVRRLWRVGVVGLASAMVLMLVGAAVNDQGRCAVVAHLVSARRVSRCRAGRFHAARNCPISGPCWSMPVVCRARGSTSASVSCCRRSARLACSSIDTLVLTHGDPDHIGGAPAVLRRFLAATDLGRCAGSAARRPARSDVCGAALRRRLADRAGGATVSCPVASRFESFTRHLRTGSGSACGTKTLIVLEIAAG